MAIKSLKDHAIFANLVRLRDLLQNEIFHSPLVVADENVKFNFDKVRDVEASLRSLLDQTPVTLVSESALNQMNANLQSPINEITAFISDKNPAHLTNAVNQLDQNVFSFTWAFLPKVNPLSETDAIALVDSLREGSRIAMNQIEAQKKQLESTILQLAETVKMQEGQLSEIKEAHTKLKGEMAASLSNLETVFNKSELQRDTDFSNLITEVKVKQAKSDKEFNETADDVIAALNKHKEDAARIVEVVGEIGVTGNYQNIANQETKQANLWRWITVGLFSCGLLMAGSTFYKFYHEPITGTNTLAIAVRLLYALAIAAPAFYTARESARHRTNADRARQTELELASLGPFIELMNEEDKKEIRKSLIPKYFGKIVEVHEIKTVLDAGTKS